MFFKYMYGLGFLFCMNNDDDRSTFALRKLHFDTKMSSTAHSETSLSSPPELKTPQLPISLVYSRVGVNAFLYLFASVFANPNFLYSRGFQLSIVGAYRALQNPDLLSRHFN